MEWGERLGVQLFAAVVVAAWTCVNSGLLFFALNMLDLLRVSKEVEESGLDLKEHGGKAVSYARAYSLNPKAKQMHQRTEMGVLDK